MGMTHGNPDTFPHLGQAHLLLQAGAGGGCGRGGRDCSATTATGPTASSALKYAIHDWGVERFREVLAGSSASRWSPPGLWLTASADHSGWIAGRRRKLVLLRLSVENGRIKDGGAAPRPGCARSPSVHRASFVMTPMQDLILAGVTGANKPAIEKLLHEHGVHGP